MNPKQKRESPVGSKEIVVPQPGEYWEHSYHGVVKIVRRWNDHECVCDILAYENRPIEVRRRLLCDDLMKGRLGHNDGAETSATDDNREPKTS